jgi:hypothetical protein
MCNIQIIVYRILPQMRVSWERSSGRPGVGREPFLLSNNCRGHGGYTGEG